MQKNQLGDGGKHFCNGEQAMFAAVFCFNPNALIWNKSNQNKHTCNGLKTMLLTSSKCHYLTPGIKQGIGYEISKRR